MDDEKRWRFTFPPPSIHQDATPEIIRGWYNRQWEGQSGYREFVEGKNEDGKRPFVFGTIDDHDYGANNGDATYRFRRESNLEFMKFLYAGVSEDHDDCGYGACLEETRSDLLDGVADESGTSNEDGSESVCSNQNTKQTRESKAKRRRKSNDPMYQRALQGKGVYGVQLFDFSRDPEASITHDDVLWGNGYWVPEDEALIDPDVTPGRNDSAKPTYSTTHSVAIFVLDVRSNKTPWPNKIKHSTPNHSTTSTGIEQWSEQYSFCQWGCSHESDFEEGLCSSRSSGRMGSGRGFSYVSAAAIDRSDHIGHDAFMGNIVQLAAETSSMAFMAILVFY